jgi:hypothetical protein
MLLSSHSLSVPTYLLTQLTHSLARSSIITLQHIFIIGAYFHYAGGFNPPQSLDISPNPGRSDPMYIIQATKAAK